jgi:hypothetical protein
LKFWNFEILWKGLGAIRAKIGPTSDVDKIFSKMYSQYVLFRNKYSKLICVSNSSQRIDNTALEHVFIPEINPHCLLSQIYALFIEFYYALFLFLFFWKICIIIQWYVSSRYMLKLHEWSHEIWFKNVIFKYKNYVPHLLFHVQIVVFRNSFFRHLNKALIIKKICRKWVTLRHYYSFTLTS